MKIKTEFDDLVLVKPEYENLVRDYFKFRNLYESAEQLFHDGLILQSELNKIFILRQTSIRELQYVELSFHTSLNFMSPSHWKGYED
jgi:hypothetical protein